MQIGVPAETVSGETRVAATPETIKKLVAQGHVVKVQSQAGLAASVTDDAYAAAGAQITDAAGALGAELVLKVRAPSAAELTHMQSGSALIGMLNPFDAEGLQRIASAGLTSFALEAAPRTTRAQSMDVLSSQANIAGYKAVMMAADKYQRFFPMLMTAAGTVKAARVVILGVGVAGLQAIATAKRLGAVIEASDVRPSVKEQVESLGKAGVTVGQGRPVVVRWLLRANHFYDEAKDLYAPFDRLVEEDPIARSEIATLVATALKSESDAVVIINNKAEGSAPRSVEALGAAVASRL